MWKLKSDRAMRARTLMIQWEQIQGNIRRTSIQHPIDDYIPSPNHIIEQIKHVNMNTIQAEGTVNLSISELDRLRTQIFTLTQERDALQLHAQEVKLRIVVEEEYLTTRSVDDYSRYDPRNNWKIPHKLEAVKDKRILSQTETYIGLNEVKEELKKEAESNVINKLGELDRQIIELKNREEALKTAQVKKITEIEDSWNKQIQLTAELHKKELDIKQAEINQFKGVVDNKNKDAVIANLTQQIAELKLKKGFWSFIHS